MTSTAETQDLIIDRIFNSWVALPAGIRKTADETTVLSMQKICRCFQLYLENLQSKLPAASFIAEKKKLMDAFAMGTMDDALKADAESQPVLDCKRIPEFKFLLDKLDSEVVLQAAQKRKELQKSLESATFMSLVEDLKQDQSKIEDYMKKLEGARGNWSQAVAAHKRHRRHSGLQRTMEFMKVRMDVGAFCAEESIPDFPKHYSVFKAHSAREITSFGGEDTCEAQKLRYAGFFILINASLRDLILIASPLTEGNFGHLGFQCQPEPDHHGPHDPKCCIYLPAVAFVCCAGQIPFEDHITG